MIMPEKFHWQGWSVQTYQESFAFLRGELHDPVVLPTWFHVNYQTRIMQDLVHLPAFGYALDSSPKLAPIAKCIKSINQLPQTYTKEPPFPIPTMSAPVTASQEFDILSKM